MSAPRWDRFKEIQPVARGDGTWQMRNWNISQLSKGHWIAREVWSYEDKCLTDETTLPAIQAPTFNSLVISVRQWLCALDRLSYLSVESRQLNQELADRAEELAAGDELITEATLEMIQQITGKRPKAHGAAVALHS